MFSYPSMTGKTCLVTGATAGLGLATATALARLGATLVVVSRNEQKCLATVERLKQQTGNLLIDSIVADLSSQQDIRQLADEFKRRYTRLHVLVNNAGGQYTQRRESADGIELTLALNHLGYFLLTNLLLDMLKASAPSRIVNVSSALHRQATVNFDDIQMRQKYHGRQQYNVSKLCNVLFTYEMARRLQGAGVTVNAAAPGLVRTNFGLDNGGLDAMGKRFANLLPFAQSPEEGAQTIIYLASSPDVQDVSGRYFAKMKEEDSSQASHDVETAKRLWRWSTEMTGLAP